MQIIFVKSHVYRHKYHIALISLEVLLQLQAIVTKVLRLYRSYFDNYLTELAFSTYFMIYSKMATRTRTWHLFEHKIGLLFCHSHIESRLWLRLSWGWSWVEVHFVCFGPFWYLFLLNLGVIFSCDSSSICSNRCHVLVVVDVDVVAILLYIVK